MVYFQGEREAIRSVVCGLVALVGVTLVVGGMATASAQDLAAEQENIRQVASGLQARFEKSRTGRRLVIGAWQGAYGVAQQQAIIEPYKRAFGIELEVLRGVAGDLDLRSAVAPDVDVVELSSCRVLRFLTPAMLA